MFGYTFFDFVYILFCLVLPSSPCRQPYSHSLVEVQIVHQSVSQSASDRRRCGGSHGGDLAVLTTSINVSLVRSRGELAVVCFGQTAGLGCLVLMPCDSDCTLGR